MANEFLNSFAFGNDLVQGVRDTRKRQQVNALASQLYSDPSQSQNVLSQVAAIDPQQAAALGQAGMAQEDRQQKMLVNGARLLTSTPEQYRASVYERIRPGLSQYIPGLPEAYDSSVDEAANAIVQAQTLATGAPAGFQQLDLMAKSAGYRPGTPEYEKFFRIAGGVDPRASSAAITYKEVKGQDGRPIWVAFDPNEVGAQQVGGGVSYGSGVPSRGAAPRSERNNNPGNIEDGDFARSLPGYVGGDGRFAVFNSPEAGQAAHTRLLQSYGNRGLNTVASIIGRWSPQSDKTNAPGSTDNYAKYVAGVLGVDPNAPLDMSNPQVLGALQSAMGQFEAGTQVAQAGPNPFVGRRAEDEAAAVEQAKTNVELSNMPRRNELEAEGAAQKAAAEARSKSAADAIQALPQVLNTSDTTIRLINQALNHPGLAVATGLQGKLDPRNYTPGTDATNFRVLLDQLKGGTFLQAFQSLRGGGAITEVEGKKAENAIGRLNTEQSTEAFQQSLRELMEVAEAAKRRAIERAQNAGSGLLGGSIPAQSSPTATAPVQRARNPQTGETLILVNGQWVRE